MHYTYYTKHTCSKRIDFDLKEGKVYNVSFLGGCNGNLKALSALVEGMPKEELIKKLSSITCGNKPTSCAGQLSIAVEKASEEG